MRIRTLGNLLVLSACVSPPLAAQPKEDVIRGIEALSDELGPSSAQGTAGCRLVDFTVRQGVVLCSAGRTKPVGVDAVETDQVFFRLG
ncbi:MAG TPA: hypothetical protein VLK65_00765, partial [Vicinamibacteria bacterium]|nr:hypothetical protein [Vicinamibacteria bacterium]